jgi:hypothetical protein
MDSLIDHNVFVRTVTYHYLGKLSGVSRLGEAEFLHLSEASWVADSGRWAQALETGQVSEVEPYPGDCYVSLGSVVDISPWNHRLPRTTK